MWKMGVDDEQIRSRRLRRCEEDSEGQGDVVSPLRVVALKETRGASVFLPRGSFAFPLEGR